MLNRTVARTAVAADGTRLAWHTHLPLQDDAPGETRLPGVVLTNGIGTTENFWRDLIGELRDDHRTVHWDYRGHGSSELSASGDYSLRTQAEDLALITEAVMASGDGKPPVHLAFSMGVAVVLELYRNRPELVRALGLIAGAPDAPGNGSLFRLPGSLALARTAMKALTPAVPLLAPGIHALLGSKLIYPLGRALGVLQPRAPREDVEQMMAALTRMDPTAYWLTLRGLMDANATDVLPQVKVPTLIIAADRDVLMPASQVQRMRGALPSATFVEIADAGHAGLVEAGREIAQAVRGLVDGLGPG